jgi:hypothetical protein
VEKMMGTWHSVDTAGRADQLPQQTGDTERIVCYDER